jgi:hypothetical protein
MHTIKQQNGPKLNRAIQLKMGRGLREMYDALATEPIPHRILSVLLRLEDQVPRKRAA